MTLTHVDLFSGIGGFSLAARWAGIETIVFCERDKFCQKVLSKHWPGVPIHDDITTFDGTKYSDVFLLTGGFPCQPFSCAGKQRGKEDDRYLWPEMLRVISEIKPRWIIGENVAGFIDMGLDDCVSDLEREGYEVQPFIIPACAVNAPHRRDRVWIVANSTSIRFECRKGIKGSPLEWSISEDNFKPGSEWASETRRGIHEHDADSKRKFSNGSILTKDSPKLGRTKKEWCENRDIAELVAGISTGMGKWKVLGESPLVRVDDGIPDVLDRLKSLGNAVVPQIPYLIMKAILEAEG